MILSCSLPFSSLCSWFSLLYSADVCVVICVACSRLKGVPTKHCIISVAARVDCGELTKHSVEKRSFSCTFFSSAFQNFFWFSCIKKCVAPLASTSQIFDGLARVHQASSTPSADAKAKGFSKESSHAPCAAAAHFRWCCTLWSPDLRCPESHAHPFSATHPPTNEVKPSHNPQR